MPRSSPAILKRVSKAAVIAVTTFFSLMFSLAAQVRWETVLRFTNGQPFGSTDPVFFRDVGFYVFTLPFLSFVRSWLLTAIIFSLIATVVVYVVSYSTQRKAFDNARPVLIHIGSLIIAIAALAAMSYWMGIWELVFSPRGAVVGAGYTDMTTQVPAQLTLLFATLLWCVMVLVALWTPGPRGRVRRGLWVVLASWSARFAHRDWSEATG